MMNELRDDEVLPGRRLRVEGELDLEHAEALRRAVTEIADRWVSDDIIVDLRAAERVDEGAIAALVGAGYHAKELGHRLLVRARGTVAATFDTAASSGALVVIP